MSGRSGKADGAELRSHERENPPGWRVFAVVSRSGAALGKRNQAENEEPQPQVLFTFGFSNLKPAPSSVST